MSKTMKTIIIDRFQEEEKQTLGELRLKDKHGEVIFECYTLELPWRDNERNVSRIPKGEYLASQHVSSKFGDCIWIQNVPNRSEILIHKGNFHDDTLGCILVGEDIADIDGDGYRDVTNSTETINKMLSFIEKDLFTVHINNNFF